MQPSWKSILASFVVIHLAAMAGCQKGGDSQHPATAMTGPSGEKADGANPGSVSGPTSDRDPKRALPEADDAAGKLAVMLVRNTLTAVNHGNLTGNYTVLRDLGGPVFRERNSAAQLAAIFQRLREEKIDLSPILVQDPVFTEAPAVNQAGDLQLVGFFPTQPLQAQFRLIFKRVSAGWVIGTVAVGTAAPQASPQNAGNSPAQPTNVAGRKLDGNSR